MAETPYIDKLKLPSGNAYEIRDTTAREAIAALEGGSYFLGITTTALTDQSTTNPVMIDGQSVSAHNGNIVIYGSAEFIFNGTKWYEFGDLSNLGTLATKNSVTLDKGSGDNVLGEATTFSTSTSSVLFSAHTTETFVKSYPGATSKLATTTVPNVTNVGSASTWSFVMGSGADAGTLIISGTNSSVPTLGTAITCATGSLNANGGGSSVMTGLGTPNTDTAIKSLGAATAQAQAITVGTNDKVKVAKYDDLGVTVS